MSRPPEPLPRKRYLGDGAYCELDPGGALVLTTSADRLRNTAVNTIVLEPETWRALEKFVEVLRQLEVPL